MSELILNVVETALPGGGGGGGGRKRGSGSEGGGGGSRKHQRFVRRRRFLERKGFLRQKQLPPAPALGASREGPGKRRKEGPTPPPPPGPAGGAASSSSWEPSGARAGGSSGGLLLAKPLKMVAIDCEMVGTGPGGRNSDLARCSVVSYQGEVVYDQYIRPLSPITNYRTRWSGIRRHHMAHAVPFKAAQKEILKLLSGKIVVGHAIHNDFKALKYFHPKSLTRDTSRIPLLNRKAGFPENESASLKRLTKQLLHRDIQVGQNGHSSVEDARATMELYKVIEVEWERHLASCPPQD